MVTLSSVTTPSTNVNPNREQVPARDDTASRDRLATTRPSGASVAKTDPNAQKNYRSFDFSESKTPDPSELQGNRRGSLLDLTV